MGFMIWTTFNLHHLRMLSQELQLFWIIDILRFLKMYFLWIILWKTLNKFWLIGFFHKKIFFSFNLYTYISIQIFDPTLEFYLNTRDNELKTWIYTTWACFHISNSISGYLDFGRKIFLSIFLFHSSPPPQL